MSQGVRDASRGVPKNIRVRARFLLCWDGTDHVLRRDAELVYRGDEIIFAGHRWDGPVDEEIDAGNALVMPGLIDLDALADIDHMLLDSWGDRDVTGGFNWSWEYARSPREVFNQEERAIVREFAIAQLARHGVTTFMPIASEVHSGWAETCQDFKDVAEIAQRIGLRGYMGPSYRAGVNVFDHEGPDVYQDPAKGAEGLAEAVAFLDYVQGIDSDLIHGALLPCRIETLTMDLMKQTADLARERDVPVRLHCLQGARESVYTARWWNMGVVDALEHSGLLSAKLLIPHGRELGDLRDPEVVAGPDVQRLVAAGTPIIHCPMTSARNGSTLRSFEAYREAGLSMVMGTDSFPPDLIRGIDIGVQIAKVMDASASAGKVENFLRAATSDAANALGRRDIGRLAVGAKADFVIADLSDFATGVVEDPIRTLVVNASGRDIVRTVVAGRTVMSDGVVHGVDDMRELSRRAQKLFDKMREAYPHRDYLGRDADTLFPPAFSVAE